MRVLVVDDEPPARRKVRAHLQAEPGVEVVGEAGDGLEAVAAVRELQPDLVFLDVQMPGLDGFEVLAALDVPLPAVVFVTAFDEYAVQAFEVEAVDYLLKPFDAERFRKAFARARRSLEGGADRGRPGSLASLLARVEAGRPLKRLVVSDRGRVVFVPLHEVTHLSAEGNYVRVHTATGTHLMRETLAHLETRLDGERFARIHRSAIVAVDAIAEVHAGGHGDYRVLLRTGETLRLSRRYGARLLAPES